MKKVFLSVIAILSIFVLMNAASAKAKEKVPVYMFTKEGCSACSSAHTYFENLSKENPDMFELIEYQVFDSNWKAESDDLHKLLKAVYERFDEDSENMATPTIVIGDYHTIGLPRDTEVIYEAIKDVQNSKKPVDEVQKLIKKLKVNVEPVENAVEKVPVYMFTKEGCSACSSAHAYFENLSKENPDLFELIEYQVYDANWNVVNEEYNQLVKAVYKHFGENSDEVATPTIVIGDYHTIGLPNDTKPVYEAIKKVRDSEEKVDVVQNLVKDLNNNVKSEEKNDGLIVGLIFGVIILGFGGLVLLSRKK